MKQHRLNRQQIDTLKRLLSIAQRDTGQSRKVADFLLAWSAEENGGWDPTDMWAVDSQIMMDMLFALMLIAGNHGLYLPDFGFEKEIAAVWKLWRGDTSKCPWCAQGNPRVRSSVSDAYVHTDTPLGRVVCAAEKPGA